jgi:hypothetical protein
MEVMWLFSRSPSKIKGYSTPQGMGKKHTKKIKFLEVCTFLLSFSSSFYFSSIILAYICIKINLGNVLISSPTIRFK